MQLDFKNHTYTFELPQIAQYDDYQYSAECCCPECSRHYRPGEWLEHNTEGIQGYCVQNDGSYMLCIECPVCFTKYRYHYVEKWKRIGDKIVFDVDYWKHHVALAMYLQNKKNNNE